MKLRLQIFLFNIILFVSTNTFSQYIQIDDTFTAQQLVQNFFSVNSCASVNNITVSGGDFGTSQQSFGYFSNGTSNFPFTNGIILSTGRAISGIGPNSSLLSEGATNWAGDLDLENALGISNTVNATVLEFDFTPLTNKISFDYIFSSEQYLTNPSSSQCGFTDGFAFLLKPLGTALYQNLALVPGTTIPVTVNNVRGSGTVCTPANTTYFDAFNGINHPTNFNGQTVVMKAQANVIIGTTYHIKLVIADQGNNLYDSAIFLGGGSFESVTNLGTNRLVATNNPYCLGENITLNATQAGNNTYKWFKNGIDTGITTPSYTITDNTNTAIVDYSVQVTINGTCTSQGEIKIQFAPLPILSNQLLVACDDNNDGSTFFNLKKLDDLIRNGSTTLGNVTYYSTNGGTQILNTTSYFSSNATIYAEVSNSYGCKSIATVTLQIANNSIPTQNDIEVCDDVDNKIDGIANIPLPTTLIGIPAGLILEYYKTPQEAVNEQNKLLIPFRNTIPNSQTLYIKIINGGDCYGIVPINIVINSLNPANFEDETIFLCNSTSIKLSIANTFASYNWIGLNDFDFETEITLPGNYSVQVTDINGCKATKKFVIILSDAATNINAVINDFTGNNNTVTITYTDNGGDYVFSIDGTNYQENPIFTNLSAGEYTISVKDKNGCLPIPSKVIYILDYPKFFTPNGDGINDTWAIKNIKTKPNSTINIFDRFGKLLKQIDSNSSGWNGTYNGETLPSADYWFVLTLFNNKTIKNHFTLKR